MQFGIFTVGDVTTDPTTGRTPTEHERIKAHHRHREEGGGGRARRLRDGGAPQPAVRPVRADHDAGLHRRPDRAADPLDGHHAHHDDRPGAHRGGLRDAAAPVRRPQRPHARPRQHRPGLPVVRQGHPPGHPAGHRELRAAAPAVARGRRRLAGQVPHAAAGLHRDAAAAGRRAAVRLARLDPQPRDRRAGRLLRRRLLRQPHLLAGVAHRADGRLLPEAVRALRPRHAPTRRSSASAARSSCGRTARTPSASSGPTSTTRRSTGTARRWRTSPARRR